MNRAESGTFEFEYQDISGVTLRCRTNGCNWQSTGQITIEVGSEAVVESPLVETGRQHHISKNIRSLHNQFYLFRNGKRAGFASISSDSCSGTLTD